MQSVLDQVSASNVKVYVVWEPIRLFDRAGAAERDRALVADPRAAHYWARDLRLAKAFQAPIGLTTEPAWDVYLLYPSGDRWAEGSAPTPLDFMHQLAGRLPDSKLLEETELARRVNALAVLPEDAGAPSSGDRSRAPSPNLPGN